MKRRLILIAAFAAALLPQPSIHAAGDGAVMLVGGTLALNKGVIWRNLTKIANRREGENLVVAAAHARPRMFGEFALRAFERYGETAQLVPLAETFQEFSTDHRLAVKDHELASRIQQSRSVFFVGGAPQRLAHVLLDDSGSPTAAADAVRHVHRSGGLIIGGIPGVAGAATRVDPMDALRHWKIDSDQLYRGLDLMDGMLVDQLFFAPGRLAITLIVMHQLDIDLGIGVDFDTAAVIHGDTVEVIGERGVVAIDMTQTTAQTTASGMHLKGIRLSYLESGDRFDIGALKTVPHAHKLGEFDLNPLPPAPDAAFSAVSREILLPGELKSIMLAAVEGETGQAAGYAYFPGSQSGYRFRFYAGQDTKGWLSAYTGDLGQTLAHVYLDIEPVGNMLSGAAFHKLALNAGD